MSGRGAVHPGAAGLLAGLAALAGSAHAQSPDVQLAPSRVVECLTPPTAQRGEPEYPFAPWKRGEGGRVLVEMVFGGPNLEPEVRVLENQGDDSLVKAVKTHVAAFRTPCAETADLPVRLRQEYVFMPDKRKAVWTTPADAADPARRRLLGCMAAQDGSKQPDYPTWARRAGLQGSLLAHLRFTAPDQPPQVTTHAASRLMKDLAQHVVLPWAAKLRLPCIEGAAVEAVYTFSFRLGDEVFGFRSLGFLQFLRAAKNLDQAGAAFDTTTMACPFDLRLQYRQPYYPSVVGEVGEPVPARQPLLAWLSTLELDLKPVQLDAVIGDIAKFTVPCVKIDLTPKEKTS